MGDGATGDERMVRAAEPRARTRNGLQLGLLTLNQLLAGIGVATGMALAAILVTDLTGVEAMELVLAAIEEGGNRAGAVAAARDGRRRESILGPYSIGPDGVTTRTDYGRLAVVDRQLVRDL